MYLLCQYYAHRDPARAAELEFCIRDNIRNGHQVVLFEEHRAPEDIRAAAFRCVEYPQRVTFSYLLQWANQNLPAGSVAAIINLDIMIRFSHDAVAAHLQQYPHHFLCLSRLEFDPATNSASPNPNLEADRYMLAQDAWVFRTPVPAFPRADFHVGNCPGCDNAIAFRAAEAGLLPINLAGTFPVWHYDLARAKNAFTMMTKDNTTSLVQPEKHGRLLLPRICVGEMVNTKYFLANARQHANTFVQKHGYSPESDVRQTAVLAAITAGRMAPAQWDVHYFVACLGIGLVSFLDNRPHVMQPGA